jgi:hypothetical protein
MKQATKQTIGAALAASNVASINTVDREQAALIVKAIRETVKARVTLEKKGAGMFGFILKAVIAGASFAGMEAAETDLLKDKKVNATYKPVKSMIEGAKALGVSLVDAEGVPVTKAVLTHDSLIAKAKKNGVDVTDKTDAEIRAELREEKEDKNGKTVGPVKVTATAEQLIESAFAHLETSSEMRALFAGKIRAIAVTLANDEAVAKALKEAAAQSATMTRKEKRAKVAADAEAARQALAADYAANGLTKSADETATAETATA